MLLVVCQLSRDVIGYEDSNFTGAFRSVYYPNLTVVVFSQIVELVILS